MGAKIHVGDVGVIFEVTVYDPNDEVVDLTGLTVARFRFQKPDDTTVDKNGSLSGDGNDGKVRWVSTLVADYDQEGYWWLQVKTTIPSFALSTERVKFRVWPTLADPVV